MASDQLCSATGESVNVMSLGPTTHGHTESNLVEKASNGAMGGETSTVPIPPLADIENSNKDKARVLERRQTPGSQGNDSRPLKVVLNRGTFLIPWKLSNTFEKLATECSQLSVEGDTSLYIKEVSLVTQKSPTDKILPRYFEQLVKPGATIRVVMSDSSASVYGDNHSQPDESQYEPAQKDSGAEEATNWPVLEPLYEAMIADEDKRPYLQWEQAAPSLASKEKSGTPQGLFAFFQSLITLRKTTSSTSMAMRSSAESKIDEKLQRGIASYLMIPMDKAGPWIWLVMQRMQNTAADAEFENLDVSACSLALIKALRAFDKPPEQLKIGHLLQECYRRRVFDRPAESSLLQLKQQITIVVKVLCLFNVWEESIIHPDTSLRTPIKALQDTLVIGPLDSTFTEIFNLPVSSLLEQAKKRDYGYRRHYALPSLHTSSAESTNTDTELFKVDDLDVGTIMSIAEIAIIWTPIMAEHLSLQIGGYRDDSSGSDESTIKLSTGVRIFWFDTESISWLGSLLLNHDEAKLETLAREVRGTWSFLFHGVKRAKVRRGYEALEVPSWARKYLEKLSPETKTKSHLGPEGEDLIALEEADPPPPRNIKWALQNGLEEYSFDVRQHLQESLRKYNISKKGGYSYPLFPNFRRNILVLRRYMDKEQHKTLVQLWKDSRNSLNYFTFWGVIIFGLASVFLALSSLAVSIAQTWASFKALGY